MRQKPRPGPKPSQAKPDFWLLARLTISSSPGRLKPGQSRGFEAKPQPAHHYLPMPSSCSLRVTWASFSSAPSCWLCCVFSCSTRRVYLVSHSLHRVYDGWEGAVVVAVEINDAVPVQVVSAALSQRDTECVCDFKKYYCGVRNGAREMVISCRIPSISCLPGTLRPCCA